MYVLKVAPTGTAAYNINGSTIHSAFALPLQSTQYLPLSSEKLAKLRSKYSSLTVLIIDEISMVGTKLFSFIHQRLQEIKDTRSANSVFGNVCILAVGDFYQLPPVMQKYIFQEISNEPYASLGSHLWKDNFEILELNTVVRQCNDKAFANILNRLRRNKLTQEDKTILSSRQILYNIHCDDYSKDVLHVFSTNSNKDEHNMAILSTNGNRLLQIKANEKHRILKKSDNTNQVRVKPGNLVEMLHIKIGARVMLCMNVDVEDGLCNSTLGTLVETEEDPDTKQTQALWIQFDDPTVGFISRRTYQSVKHKNATRIVKQEAYDTGKSSANLQISRIQFPVVLAYATTIHKVQGMTCEKIVVSLDGFSLAGMAYVALSRVRTLNGLYLLSFDSQKVRCSKLVESEMSRLRAEC